jgi:hypothetical protein
MLSSSTAIASAGSAAQQLSPRRAQQLPPRQAQQLSPALASTGSAAITSMTQQLSGFRLNGLSSSAAVASIGSAAQQL